MGDNSAIEWTDASWNPTRGCSIVSPGCHNCYAMRDAMRFSGPGGAYEGLVKATRSGPQWTGMLRLVESQLSLPERWTRPRKIFVNSMSDLFHERFSFEDRARVFDVMCSPTVRRHVFQVLTKRPEQIAPFIERYLQERAGLDVVSGNCIPANVWLGTSVECDKYAWRIGALRAIRPTPSRVMAAGALFVSLEPLLGSVATLDLDGIDWTIIGGESGPRARPCALEWIRGALSVSRGHGAAPFVKQLGAVPVMDAAAWRALRLTPMLNHRNARRAPEGMEPLWYSSRKGAEIAEWPEDLRVREYPVTDWPGSARWPSNDFNTPASRALMARMAVSKESGR